MKLALENLESRLKNTLAPVYLVAGDEPLQREEAADAIRAAARARGHADREVLFAERGFDWNQLNSAGANLSLFASKRILEVRLPTGKPGDDGAQALIAYAKDPAPDMLLLVISAKLDRGGGRWAVALEQAGALVSIWPIDIKNLPGWIGRRMQKLGLIPTPEAVALIAGRVEGNLLAAAQEVEKLLLLHGPGPVDVAAAREAVADSARYDPYALVDAALEGNPRRAAHILKGLEEEGAEPTFILWALTREIRSLTGVAWDIRGGLPLQRALASVWEKRRALVQKALGRHHHQDWHKLLALAAHTDRVLKGQAAGRPWDELLNLSVSLADHQRPM
ncbi:MAG TPA: DNA polymerase III subunit delta [Gammaproteobacteria bacterium]|nr:DNA polymerase III subunit delta [Gammaproteobacteria bacterium]